MGLCPPIFKSYASQVRTDWSKQHDMKTILRLPTAAKVCSPPRIGLNDREIKRSTAMMDTKTLVVRQEVYMSSEAHTCKGKVSKVTPEGVEVRATVQSNLKSIGGLLRFDKDGKGCDGQGTHDYGPWYMTDSCARCPNCR